MKIFDKSWRRNVFWPRLTGVAFILACLYALLIGFEPRPF